MKGNIYQYVAEMTQVIEKSQNIRHRAVGALHWQ